MTVLLGASGYIGQAFEAYLRERRLPYSALTRRDLDYTRFNVLLEFLRGKKPQFLINAAGYTGKPNVDACETAKAETLFGNSLFPQTVAQACLVTGTPWGHVSSGCIFSGAKIVQSGQERSEKDMTRPDLRKLAETSPDAIHGYTE